MAEETFPSWRYGPGDQAQIFQSADDVPKGWEDHPSKVAERPAKPQLDRDGRDGPGGSLPGNVMKLKSIAKAEEIDIAGLSKATDIQTAILAARAAKA